MISKYSKYELGNLKIEANYDGSSTPCKTIKFTIDDKVAIIDSHDLYALLMLYADDEQMGEMVKSTNKQVKMIRKAVKVTTHKDLKDCKAARKIKKDKEEKIKRNKEGKLKDE